MEVEFRKDLRHNYMVMEWKDCRAAGLYSIKMLEQQKIAGFLPVEQRSIDNKVFLYYEITAKQAMVNLLEKSSLSYDKMKELCGGIIETIESAYEYLLPEDDFIISPEYIYLDITTNTSSLCYYPDYDKNIKNQISSFLEYLMNKVDYNDKDAVLLVYQLYAISKEEGCTLDQLKEVLKVKEVNSTNAESTGRFDSTTKNDTSEINKLNLTDGKPQGHEKIRINQDHIQSAVNKMSDEEAIVHKQLSGVKSEKDIPVMMEKVEGEVEISCYSIKTYLYSAACILAGVLILAGSFMTGIIYNSFGNRIDYLKLFALLLIILCVEGYLLNKLLDKKNKITRMVKTKEYIDPREDYDDRGDSVEDKKNSTDRIQNEPHRLYIDYTANASLTKPKLSESIPKYSVKATVASEISKVTQITDEDDYNPTCILNETSDKEGKLILKALDQINYKNILISSFPFFIGKLRKKVDYCLEKDVVSRFHAKLSKEEGVYYITDLNSTNGTYVNQEQLNTYQKKEIKIGDEIAFANIKYIFIEQ